MSGDFESLMERMLPGAGFTEGVDADTPALPTSLGMEPRGVLGRGGTGWVYRAHDPVLGRDVAVKITRSEGGETAREALLAEAQRTARLAHPAILSVHRVTAVEGNLAVVFELAPTRTLADLAASWRHRPEQIWTPEQRLQLLSIVADAVAHAHGLDVVHGDLKPANIAIGAHTNPVVLDWGGLSMGVGTFSGSPAWASPEQLHGEPPAEASDVFSLGVIIYELFANQPFRESVPGRSLGEMVARWRQEAVPPLAVVEAVDPTLVEVVDKALQSDPSERPTARTLASTLLSVFSGRSERSRRDAEAAASLEASRKALARFRQRERRLVSEQRVLAIQSQKVPPGSDPSSKRALWQAEDRVSELLDLQSLDWTLAVEQAQRALAMRPSDDDIHRVLAELWWERLLMAEARGYIAEAQLCASRLQLHDRGQFAGALAGKGTLTVRAPDDANVTVSRLEEIDRRLQPTAPLDVAPDGVEVPAGRWQITVEMHERPAVHQVTRLARLDGLEIEIRVPPDVPEGWSFVPPGTFILGGDTHAREPIERCEPHLDGFLVQTLPVTTGDWRDFLDALGDEADDHVPVGHTPFGEPPRLWGRTDRWNPPAGWSDDLPIVGITHPSAEAYARWLSQTLGATVRLPSEEEWEKAARGGDGRCFPWGDRFDPSFCQMRRTDAGALRPRPVGTRPFDVGPHGMRDAAGGVREWTSSGWGDGRIVVRGGSWRSDAEDCRLASRAPRATDQPALDLGFRLVREL